MKLIALVQDAESIARYLRHLGLPTEVPPVAPLSGARACPPCPCPTRLRRARRPREGHRSGRAASSAVATASHPTRPRRRGSLQPLLRSSPATRPARQRGKVSVCPELRNQLPRAWVRVGIQQSLPPGLGVQATDHKIATAPNTPRGPLFRLRPSTTSPWLRPAGCPSATIPVGSRACKKPESSWPRCLACFPRRFWSATTRASHRTPREPDAAPETGRRAMVTSPARAVPMAPVALWPERIKTLRHVAQTCPPSRRAHQALPSWVVHAARR
jgi:hypothetical protein